jgi:hypothetical protein
MAKKDITSNILKNIFSKKLTKAKEGIAKSLRNKSFKAIEDYKNSFTFDLPHTDSVKEDVNDLKRANKDKVTALKKANKEKEAEVKRSDMEKESEKNNAEREKDAEKSKDKKEQDLNVPFSKFKPESIVNKVVEYIQSDGKRRKCAGGDGRRTENHDCDKVHSDMSHKEWEASQDTPKDEASGGKEAYKKFFDAKLKKYGVSSPAELEGEAKKKFYDEIDAEWEGDNETD